MMMTNFRRHGAIIALFALLPLQVLNAAETEDVIKYRQNVMRVIGGHTGALFAIAGNKAGDPSHMGVHVRGLVDISTIAGDIFPEGSDFGETRAKPEIWSDPDGFAMALKNFQDAAMGVGNAFDNNGDMGAALKKLGGACKGCHDDYRSKE
ncbi:MAG: cytochrome c [marine bacterium B5-7]|nr:MAG: cytochrome c [marine bacterium B5-7]